MRLLDESTWQRHANPWSGWTRLLTYPLLFVAVWRHDWLMVGLVTLWFALNPRLFPAPSHTRAWMSRGVLGERLWTGNGVQRDLAMLLVVLMLPLFVAGMYAAWQRWLWPTVALAAAVFLLKLCFVARMVRLYDGHRADREGGQD